MTGFIQSTRRMLILGPCGAGKSTLARRLGVLLDLPVVHLDRLNWNAGWEMAPPHEFRQRVMDAAREDRWIIDGNYGATLHLRLPYADTIILLLFARWRCMARVLKRLVMHAGRTRPDMGEGCREKLDWEFLEFVWNHFEEGLPRLMSKLSRLPPGCRLIVLREPGEVERFVSELEHQVMLSNNLLSQMY